MNHDINTKRFFSPHGIWIDGMLAVIRILVGAFMIYHGKEVFEAPLMMEYEKRMIDMQFSAPLFMAYLGKMCELVAGILLLLGFLTRIASIILVCTMMFITFLIGEGRIFMEEQHPFLLVLFGLLFLFNGGGRWSLDNVFFNPTH